MAAVASFQLRNMISRTGVADHETLTALYADGAQTAKPTVKPTKRPKATPRPTATPKPEKTVFITRTGECYHRIDNCGTSKYVTGITLSEAQRMGYSKCSRCY